jgi:hypothetical protein
LPAAREIAEAYLAGRADGTIEPFEVPVDPAEPADEWADYDLPIATAVQGTAALAALHDLLCPGVEKVITVPAELPPMEEVMPAGLRREWQRALSWRATLVRVRGLREFALPWFVLQIHRLERNLLSSQTQYDAPAVTASEPTTAVLPAPEGASHTQKEQPRDPNWQSLLAIVADENTLAVLKVAQDLTKTADERMRTIYVIDNRVVGWTSGKWAEALSVTDAAVRQTDWWKIDRKRLRR